LSERITGGEAGDLAAQLPQELKEAAQRSGEEAETHGSLKFGRVSEIALCWGHE
jgi:uncharacterized protein (DUF2267 family)